MAKHYDVVVLGAGIGALSTAALLARRSWRVLVLGQGERPAHYVYDKLPHARRPFTFLAGASPAWARILAELAQSQTFRRHVRSLDPMLQVLEPRVRLEIPPDSQLFGRELDREFPEVRRVVDELYAELARTNEVVDAAFQRDVVWPPGTFWERRETSRVAATMPHFHEGAKDLLAEFPHEHPYRSVVLTTVRFASDLAPPFPPLSVARLHGAWTRGVSELLRGEADVTDFLVDRVRAHGGDARLGERASYIATRHGKVTGVVLEGDEEVTGVQFVVTEGSSPSVLELARDYRPSRRALDARPELALESNRFVTSFLVRREGLPAPLATESFLLSGSAPDRAVAPIVHLQISPDERTPEGMVLLVAESFVSGRLEPKDLARTRASVVAVVESFLPFIERHYVAIDSPHDGLPLWDYRSGKRVLVDRTKVRPGGGTVEAETMVPQLRVHGGSLEGVGGEPIRFPLAGAFGVGRSILPGLGQEGELLAAWGAARTITRTDRKKEKMRREMWSKVELG